MGMFDKLLKLNFRNEYFLLSSNVPFDAYFQRELLTVVKPCARLFSSEKRERRACDGRGSTRNVVSRRTAASGRLRIVASLSSRYSYVIQTFPMESTTTSFQT